MHVCVCKCVCEHPHACVFMSSGEMVSHDHMAGLVSHLWQGKDKDSNGTYAREHAHIHSLHSYEAGLL